MRIPNFATTQSPRAYALRNAFLIRCEEEKRNFPDNIKRTNGVKLCWQ